MKAFVKLTSIPWWILVAISLWNAVLVVLLLFGDRAESAARIKELEAQGQIQAEKQDALGRAFEALRADIHKMRTTINRVDARVLKAERDRQGGKKE